ncbi:MAG: 4Fe-4S binding protein [Oscillospiraceae bacterium]|nr:4Fe-4S binding protein [Oscillospiraceae bacterium]
MAYYINEDCISCGACEPECVVSCISAGDEIYLIDEETCVDCGACAGVCPVDAPKPR